MKAHLNDTATRLKQAMQEKVVSPFAKKTFIRKTIDWYKSGPVYKKIASGFANRPQLTTEELYRKSYNQAVKLIRKNNTFVRRVGRTSIRKAFSAGLVLGTVSLLGVALMKGVLNTASQIVAQRHIQDQRYARNITMMSRLGFSYGTSSMNRYGHTIGLSQALSRNRHGRGGY